MSSDSEEYVECERCEHEVPNGERISVELNDEYSLCSSCVGYLDREVEDFWWYDRLPKEQFERAVEILQEQDEILCVHETSYQNSMIMVHTNYVNSDVVRDVCDHFGFHVESFGPAWQQETRYRCVRENGSCFYINLTYRPRADYPAPMEVKFVPRWRDNLVDTDKQFDAGQ